MFLLNIPCYCESFFKLVTHFNQQFFTFHGTRNFFLYFIKPSYCKLPTTPESILLPLIRLKTILPFVPRLQFLSLRIWYNFISIYNFLCVLHAPVANIFPYTSLWSIPWRCKYDLHRQVDIYMCNVWQLTDIKLLQLVFLLILRYNAGSVVTSFCRYSISPVHLCYERERRFSSLLMEE